MNEYREINFTEEDHRYFDDKGNTYTSATTLIGEYKPKYDKDFWSMYTALKEAHFKVRPKPKEHIIYVNTVKYKLKDLKKDSIFLNMQKSILHKWEADTQKACLRGNKIHDFLEENINKSKDDYQGKTNQQIRPLFDFEGEKEKNIETVHDLKKTSIGDRYPGVYERLKLYIENGWIIYAEKRVHLEKYKVAGMIDVPLIKGNKFAILDWKTNKDKIRKHPGYYKKEKINNQFVKTNRFIITKDTFKHPISHVPASKFHIYALQLSLYSYMLEQWGYTPAKNHLEIIHMMPEMEPVLIKIPYMKAEIEEILEHHYINLN